MLVISYNTYVYKLRLYIKKRYFIKYHIDVLNIISLKITSLAEEYYRKLNPRNNLFIDRNDGLYNLDAGLFKDQIIGLYSFCNI